MGEPFLAPTQCSKPPPLTHAVGARETPQMSLVDFAAEQNGGQISGSTSYDEQHPPSNIIDGDSKSFWVSTGLYPQEFTVELAGCTDISTVKIAVCNVKKLVIEKCDSEEPTSFQKVSEIDLGSEGNAHNPELNQQDIKLSGTTARHVKFIISDGWSDYCAVYHVGIE